MSIFLHRAIELAQKGLGSVTPNPMVGAVIVHQNRIIGEGYHQKYGEAHAEVNAIASVSEKDQHLLSQSTMYVTLEPCAHFGKTPPCAKLLVEKKIPKVVIGCLDPNPKVAGKGVQILEEAGIEVLTNMEVEACRHLSRRFLTFQEKKRPYIILKWAETADGFFAPLAGEKQRWISNAIAKRLSHRWRTEEGAILVGTRTAAIDNPKLTPRLWKGRPPLRLVIDRQLRLPSPLHLFDGTCPTVVFTKNQTTDQTNLKYQVIDFSKNVIPQILDYLYQQKINSLIVEGGQQVLQSFINLEMWDEARIFVGEQYWGGGLVAPKLNSMGKVVREKIGNNELKILTKLLNG